MPEAGRVLARGPKSPWPDRGASYRIEIDGGEVGKVANGSEIEVEVAPGLHVVKATVVGNGSPPVEVNVASGRTTRLTVQPAGSALQAGFQVFKGDGWLKLLVE